METDSGLEGKLIIIIPTYNAKQFLEQCLNSIAPTLLDREIKCVVIDNASTDGSADMVAQNFPQVMLKRNQRNLGFSKAINRVLSLVNSRYVLLLNDDTIVLDGAVRAMLDFMDQHQDAGMLGGKLLNPDGSLQVSTYRFPSLARMLLRITGLRKPFTRGRTAMKRLSNRLPNQVTKYVRRLGQRDHARPVEVVQGSFCMVRMDAVCDVGLLDETTFMYMEETDWARRFALAGWKTYFLPDAAAIHFGGENIEDGGRGRKMDLREEGLILIEKRRGMLNYADKYFSPLGLTVLKSAIILFAAARLAILSLLLPFFPRSSVKVLLETQSRLLAAAKGFRPQGNCQG